MRKKRSYLLYIGLGFTTMLISGVLGNFWGLSMQQFAKRASVKINSKAAFCELQAQKLASAGYKNPAPGNDLFEKEQTGLYFYVNDSLVYWNNAQWNIKAPPSSFKHSSGFIKLKHGYFLYAKKQGPEGTAIALSIVKPHYELQNNYLKNDFANWLNIPKDVTIDTGLTSGSTVMLNNTALFALKGNEEIYFEPLKDVVLSSVFFVGFLLLLVMLLLQIRHLGNGAFCLTLGLVIAMRAAMIIFRWPGCLYRTALYDPSLFGNAQSWFNGFLGDVLLNAFCLIFFAAAMHYKLGQSSKKQKTGSIILFSLFALFLFYQFNSIIVSLVNNSTFNFDFLNILNVKLIVFIGLAGVCILSLALFITLRRLVFLIKNGPYGFWLFSLIVLFICAATQFVTAGCGLIENYWLLAAALCIYFMYRPQNGIGLSLGTYVLIIALVTSSFLNTYIEKNQALDLQVLMYRLAERQDEIFESEFASLPDKIKKDENLHNLITLLPASGVEIEQRLKQKYFNGYFYRYNINFSLFDEKNCLPMLPAKIPVLLNEGFFEDQINYYSSKIYDELFFVKGYVQNTQYITRINLGNYRLYALMEAKRFEKAGSFPDLFLDQSLQKQHKLKTFNYAVYRGAQSSERYGDFNYPYFLRDSATLAKSAPSYVHYYFEPEPGTRIVISQTRKDRNYFFTFNSYLLLLFSLLSYLCYLAYALVFTNEFKNASFTRRIQTIIILLLLLAMSAVGITSGGLVTQQFAAENRKELEEKTSFIISELNSQFNPSQLFYNTQRELLNTWLREYSRLFNTPISVFNKRGVLFNTSEPKLYDFGLAAGYANPVALNALRRNLNSAMLVNEKAGSLNYLSLYTPLFDSDKNAIGFINLPYFARQSDLVNELSQIIGALINVYVILFVLSIVAGLILSGYITQPLRLIKQQLAKITLGRQNEKIIWQSNDEIGNLVAEYNQMLHKLEESANLMARNERESAWREMAKQVAHEIKNPLTPMKLNLQYLQHLIKSDSRNFNDRFEKVSAGIIEQIDALATIATEFGNYARLPGASLQTLNLAELVSLAVDVFNNQPHVHIVNHISIADNLPVRADREQCLRVFNNVLKNAVQATEELNDAQIEVGCSRDENELAIYFSDNGRGINDELKPKIFQPNFTTKSTGSGLGLAMVKNIMEGFGGCVSFESEAGKGATFFLRFKPQLE